MNGHTHLLALFCEIFVSPVRAMAFTPFGSSFPMIDLRASLSQDYEDKREGTQVQKQSRASH